MQNVTPEPIRLPRLLLLRFFNANFDGRLVRQSANAFGVPSDWWREIDARCAMFLASMMFRATNRGRSPTGYLIITRFGRSSA